MKNILGERQIVTYEHTYVRWLVRLTNDLIRAACAVGRCPCSPSLIALRSSTNKLNIIIQPFTEPEKSLCTWLGECCRQVEAEGKQQQEKNLPNHVQNFSMAL